MPPTRLFLDTEFSGLHQAAQLISIALICEAGPAFYAELTDYDKARLSDWHRVNVLPNLFLDRLELPVSLPNTTFILGNTQTVRVALADWLASLGPVEIWADVLAWDWMLFCELFGGSFGLPSNVFYIPFDLATLFYQTGDPDISREAFAFPEPETRRMAEQIWPDSVSTKHNALWDATVSKQCFERLQTMLPLLQR